MLDARVQNWLNERCSNQYCFHLHEDGLWLELPNQELATEFHFLWL
jgi:hypothetical protein